MYIGDMKNLAKFILLNIVSLLLLVGLSTLFTLLDLQGGIDGFVGTILILFVWNPLFSLGIILLCLGIGLPLRLFEGFSKFWKKYYVSWVLIGVACICLVVGLILFVAFSGSTGFLLVAFFALPLGILHLGALKLGGRFKGKSWKILGSTISILGLTVLVTVCIFTFISLPSEPKNHGQIEYSDNLVGVWASSGNGVADVRLELSGDGTFQAIEDEVSYLLGGGSAEFYEEDTNEDTDPGPIYLGGTWEKQGGKIILSNDLAIPVQDRLKGGDEYELIIEDDQLNLHWFNHSIFMERSGDPFFDQSSCYISSMFMDLYFLGEHRVPQDVQWSDELGTCILISYSVYSNASDWAEEYRSENDVDLWVYRFSAFDLNRNTVLLEGHPTYHQTQEEYEVGVNLLEEAKHSFDLDFQSYLGRGSAYVFWNQLIEPRTFTSKDLLGSWKYSHISNLLLDISFAKNNEFEAIVYLNQDPEEPRGFSGTWELNQEKTHVFTKARLDDDLSLDFFITGNEIDGFILEAWNGEYVLEKNSL